jgi:hypothetical protein
MVHRAIVGETLGQLVPLAVAAQAEDDGVERRWRIHTWLALSSERIQLSQDRG